MKKYVVIFCLFFMTTPAWANPISTQDYVLNFSAMYGAQWTFYLVSQTNAIRDEGSSKNMQEYPFKPGFDKDGFDFNIFKHAMAGQYYYQFYRYRGYSESQAFLWTFASSLAFEFAVETYTEKPSLQDIYQTPIYGTLVGMGFERASSYLHTLDSPTARVLAYILNPFSLLTQKSGSETVFTPLLEKDAAGFQLAWRY